MLSLLLRYLIYGLHFLLIFFRRSIENLVNIKSNDPKNQSTSNRFVNSGDYRPKRFKCLYTTVEIFVQFFYDKFII